MIFWQKRMVSESQLGWWARGDESAQQRRRLNLADPLAKIN